MDLAIPIVTAVMILIALFFVIARLRPDLITPPGTISGKVTDANGAGLGNVDVFLSATGNALPEDPMTTTGPDGSYSFSNVNPGIYDVRVPKVMNMDGTYYEAKTVSGLVVQPGAAVTCDVSLVN